MRRQGGQVVVLFAVGSVALVALVGLVLMAGLLYWDQRQMQIDVDGSALAGALQVTQTCTGSTPVSYADNFMAERLGATSALSLGGWSCGSTVTDSFGGSTWTASYTYPWNNKPYEIGVSLKRFGVTLEFGAFIGASQTNISARAVAQHSFATLPDSFALFAQNGVDCSGSGVHSPSPKIEVNGSIYSGTSMNTNGNCAIIALDTVAFDGTEDFGDILVYNDSQAWYTGGGSCGVPSGTVGNAICADGFELSGHSSPTCGNGSGTSPQTEYLKDTTTQVPDPCSGLPPPVTKLYEANYSGTEPNANAAINSATGGRCTTTAGVSPGGGSAALTVGSKNYGWGPAPHLAGTVMHFVKGCYGYLDIGTFLARNSVGATSVAFDPGFYLFNGYNCNADNASGCTASTGGGLCLNASGSQSVIATGTDITLEFVNSTSFSTSSCSSGPTSACGGSACDFGTSIFAPNAPSVSVSTGTTTLPAGTYSFEVTYLDSLGETTASSATTGTLAAGGQAVISASSVAAEATKVGFYLTGCSGAAFPSGTCTSGGVYPGYLGSGTVVSSAASLTFNSKTQGDYVSTPTTNSASIWFAAPPTSPEVVTATPTVSAQTGLESNLPAGSYTFQMTYRDPEGESLGGPTTSPVAITAGQDLELTAGSASQGVSTIGFYLVSAPAGVTTGYIGQVAAPVGSTVNLFLTGTAQGNGTAAPSSNTTSSSWCSTTAFEALGYSATDAATASGICENRILWAPPAGSSLGEIAGTFYVKGSNENSAIMGDIYWPGPANSTDSANAAGCNYDANGVGGLLGQVICDSVFVQGGSASGSATIGWTSGAKYANPPEIALIE